VVIPVIGWSVVVPSNLMPLPPLRSARTRFTVVPVAAVRRSLAKSAGEGDRSHRSARLGVFR